MKECLDFPLLITNNSRKDNKSQIIIKLEIAWDHSINNMIMGISKSHSMKIYKNLNKKKEEIKRKRTKIRQ